MFATQQMPEKPELHAIVEVRERPGRLWMPLPPKPWPDSVRLSGSTPGEHVALPEHAERFVELFVSKFVRI